MLIKNYKVILFDAGGTLLHPYPSVGEIYSKIAREFGSNANAEDLNIAFRCVWQKHDGMAELQSHLDEKVEKNWWRTLVSETFDQVGGIDRFDDFFDRLYVYFASPDCWRLYPEVIGVLETIRAQKIPAAIVSNWDSRLLKLCDIFDLTKYFEFILASAVFGASKPSPAIFEEALSRLGAEPHEALHIGDSVTDDVNGARGVGVDAVLLDRHGEHGDTNNVRVMTDLRGLI